MTGLMANAVTFNPATSTIHVRGVHAGYASEDTGGHWVGIPHVGRELRVFETTDEAVAYVAGPFLGA